MRLDALAWKYAMSVMWKDLGRPVSERLRRVVDPTVESTVGERRAPDGCQRKTVVAWVHLVRTSGAARQRHRECAQPLGVEPFAAREDHDPIARSERDADIGALAGGCVRVHAAKRDPLRLRDERARLAYHDHLTRTGERQFERTALRRRNHDADVPRCHHPRPKALAERPCTARSAPHGARRGAIPARRPGRQSADAPAGRLRFPRDSRDRDHAAAESKPRTEPNPPTYRG